MIDLAIVGCGSRGREQLRAFHACANCDLLMAADIRGDILTDIAPAWPKLIYTTDANEIIENPAIEAVVIATPSSTHYALARKALLFDKHVLCEPPLAMHADQASELADIARLQGRTLMVGHPFLFDPGIRKLREQICFGECGTLHSLQATHTRTTLLPPGTHIAFELAAHDIAIVMHLLDAQPRSVRAHASDDPGAPPGHAARVVLTFPDAVAANLLVACQADRARHRLTIVGSRKTLSWDGLAQRPPVDAADPMARQAAHFLTCVGRGQTPLADGPFGARVVAVAEAAGRDISLSKTV